MPAASRQQWWREALPVLAVLALALAALGALSARKDSERPAQTPEIIYGQLRDIRHGGGRHLPDGPYLLVAFPDRTMRYLQIGNRDDRGCRPGSRVAVERRGTSLSLARTVCPDARARER